MLLVAEWLRCMASRVLSIPSSERLLGNIDGRTVSEFLRLDAKDF